MVTYVKADEPVIEENNLHFMPCQVEFDGRAKVSTYFEETEEYDHVKTASFRGRPLHGREVSIPDGYCGYVLKKPNGTFSSQGKFYEVQQSFKKFNFWNLDKIPSNNDAFLSALDWIDVSEALHSNSSKMDNGRLSSPDSSKK